MNEISELKNEMTELVMKADKIRDRLAILEQDQPDNWPEHGDMTFVFNENGHVYAEQYHMDQWKNIFGYYRTEQEATKARDYFKAVRIANDILKTKMDESLTNVLLRCLTHTHIDTRNEIKAELSKHSISLDEVLK